ncbi:MAG: ParB/RepB/Spo0J family partition protein [Ottowia sp.]|nr:ParB/RepB/Spo0J family partition protein [Ottowia sp.]
MNIYDKLGAKTAGIRARDIKKPDDKPLKTAPAMFLDATKRMDEAEIKVEVLETELKNKLGKPIFLPISSLLKSPLQTRKLDKTRVKDLAEHLTNNELTTPIIVRPQLPENGKFEIVAGHHRVEAFKILGRLEIEATIRPMNDEEAEKSIFFDNLMAPDLPDFEKYKGFAALRKRTGQSYDALARDAGVSKALIGYYFSFEKLPKAALNLLDTMPGLIGATAAQRIISLKADENKIISALQKVASGELDQKRIIAFLKDNEQKLVPRLTEKVFKKGEQVICTLKNKNNRDFVITFNKGFDSHEWHKKLISFIEKETSAHSA